MAYYVLTEACIIEYALLGGTDLSGERLAIVHAVNDETDFLTILRQPCGMQCSRGRTFF
jgi:hypothetical protein